MHFVKKKEVGQNDRFLKKMLVFPQRLIKNWNYLMSISKANNVTQKGLTKCIII